MNTDFVCRRLNPEDTEEFLGSTTSLAYSKEMLTFWRKRYSLEYSFVEVVRGGTRICVLPFGTNQRSKTGFAPFHKDYASPVVFDQRTFDHLRPQLAEILRKTFGLKGCEVRLMVRPEDPCKTDMFTYLLQIPQMAEEELLMHYRKNTRNAVRKGMRANFSFSYAGAECFGELYPLYLSNMERHGTPPKERSYFEDLFSAFGAQAKCLLARKDGVLAGANAYILTAQTLKLMLNLSVPAYWNDQVNDVLYHDLILDAQRLGVAEIDFGPTMKKDVSHAEFKIGFGAVAHPIFIGRNYSLDERLKTWLAANTQRVYRKLYKMFSKPKN